MTGFIKIFLFLFVFQTISLYAGVFTGIDNAKILYGNKIKEEDLKGKVIFFEYWGIYCPPCRKTIPQLVNLQRKYGKTRKFVLITSHIAQGLEKNAKEFLKSNNVNFPVYNQFFSKKAPKGDQGIPFAYIIDHNGKIVEKEYPVLLYSKIQKYIDAAPNPPPKALTGVKLKYWKSIESKIKAGKPYATIFVKLKKERINDTDKGREAKLIIEKINENLDLQFHDFEEKSEKEPLSVIRKLKDFTKLTKGLKVGEKASKLYTELYSDPNLKKIIAMKKEVDKIIRKMHGHTSRSLISKAKSIKKKLNKIIDTDTASDKSKTAAENLIKYMDENI